MFACTTKGTKLHSEISYAKDDVFVFGQETAGLPQALQDEFPAAMRLRLPMRPGNRSLNLSNAVAVVVFEAWRQLRFEGGA
jgi:tRNA (cytidine/uridine-2'-O-)-methyltransferase